MERRKSHLKQKLLLPDKYTKNKLEIERREEKASKGLSMWLTPGMRTQVDTGLGLGLISSSMVNGRRNIISSCGFTSNSVAQPLPFLENTRITEENKVLNSCVTSPFCWCIATARWSWR
ncbi:hypothetical protein HID58_028560 [Brassica napus]|uniref:Uncharacterized protein n=2 Tax=Brassica TaxID=3705 RepID=A0A8D9HCK6_BRACM|nr:uncharacterized protein LOC106443906 [Brassica napus]KAH0914114.1 hypothetical protein HID58_028560 [Brassica napus]CAF2217109.1 unnamed protein product [Brassica napus]CAG7896735.1 unnamed protein product [Brassica rapa]